MTITAAMVKALRERTGVGMMECKKALTAAGGDIEAAIDLMRKEGQAKVEKKAARVAKEGVILTQDRAMVELNSETDFVSRHEDFLSFGQLCLETVLATGIESAEELLSVTLEGGDTLESRRVELVRQIGENIQVRRVAMLPSDAAAIGIYQHGTRIGALVQLDQAQPELAKQLAMHVAAMNPLAIKPADVPADLLARERDIFLAQAKETAKTPEIAEKMVNGRIDKFYKEVCLLEQKFIIDGGTQTVAAVLAAAGVEVLRFQRFEVGEGIEKEVVDFAEEVRKASGDC